METVRSWASFYTPDERLDGIGLTCLGLGGQAGPVPEVRGRTLDHHALVLVSRGAGHLRDPGGTHAVSAGSVLWLRPGVEHGYGPGPGGWDERWVLLRGPAMAGYEAAGVVDADRGVSTPSGPAAEVVRRCLARLAADRSGAGPGAQARRAALLHELVAAAARPAPHDTDAVVDLLAHEPDGARTVAAHARSLGVSGAELRDRVRAATGTTTKRFLLRSRVDRAKALLAETDLPVLRVAVRVGYDDPAYFSRLFRDVAGETPTAFRERYLRTGGASAPRPQKRNRVQSAGNENHASARRGVSTRRPPPPSPDQASADGE